MYFRVQHSYRHHICTRTTAVQVHAFVYPFLFFFFTSPPATQCSSPPSLLSSLNSNISSSASSRVTPNRSRTSFSTAQVLWQNAQLSPPQLHTKTIHRSTSKTLSPLQHQSLRSTLGRMTTPRLLQYFSSPPMLMLLLNSWSVILLSTSLLHLYPPIPPSIYSHPSHPSHLFSSLHLLRVWLCQRIVTCRWLCSFMLKTSTLTWLNIKNNWQFCNVQLSYLFDAYCIFFKCEFY